MLVSKKKQSSCSKISQRFDVFGYSEPVNRTRSYAGAILSFVSFTLLVASFIAAVNNINDKVSTISAETHGMSKEAIKMPMFAVSYSRKLGHVAFNRSWTDVRFKHNIIYESDRNPDKPRKKVDLGSHKCNIETRPGTVLAAYCPYPQDKEELKMIGGEYASPKYEYITAEVVPCHDYKEEFEKEGGVCESREEIEKVFLHTYGGVSLWVENQLSHNEKQWSSQAYTSYTSTAWIGNEVYFEPTNYIKYGFWGRPIEKKTFLTYDYFHARRAAPNVNEYVKFYLRISGSSKKITEVLFGGMGIIEMVGSTWSVVVLTLGTLGLMINMCYATSKRAKLSIGGRSLSTGTFREMTDSAILTLAKNMKGVKSVLKEHGMGLKAEFDAAPSFQNPMRVSKADCHEIVFSFDTTGSMSGYIEAVKKHLKEITKELFQNIPNLRIGIIAHGDYCDEKTYYLIKELPFTKSHKTVEDFLNKCTKTGGGDAPEAYELALRTARKMKWSKGSTRALVVIGDDVPHSPSYPGNKDNIDWGIELEKLKKNGVTCFGVQCNTNSYANSFYQTLADTTGGQRLELSKFDSMPAIFVGICLQQVDPLGHLLSDYESRLESQGKLNKEQKKAFRDLTGKALLTAAGVAGGAFLKAALEV